MPTDRKNEPAPGPGRTPGKTEGGDEPQRPGPIEEPGPTPGTAEGELETVEQNLDAHHT